MNKLSFKARKLDSNNIRRLVLVLPTCVFLAVKVFCCFSRWQLFPNYIIYKKNSLHQTLKRFYYRGSYRLSLFRYVSSPFFSLGDCNKLLKVIQHEKFLMKSVFQYFFVCVCFFLQKSLVTKNLCFDHWLPFQSLALIKQDQETWLRRTLISIPLSPYQFQIISIHFHELQYMSSNFNTFQEVFSDFNNCQNLPKIAEECRRLPKIAKDCQRLPKIAIDC